MISSLGNYISRRLHNFSTHGAIGTYNLMQVHGYAIVAVQGFVRTACVGIDASLKIGTPEVDDLIIDTAVANAAAGLIMQSRTFSIASNLVSWFNIYGSYHIANEPIQLKVYGAPATAGEIEIIAHWFPISSGAYVG